MVLGVDLARCSWACGSVHCRFTRSRMPGRGSAKRYGGTAKSVRPDSRSGDARGVRTGRPGARGEAGVRGMGAGGAGGGGSGLLNDLGGCAVEDGSCGAPATCGTARRDERHSVGTGCGGLHTGPARGAGSRPAGGGGIMVRRPPEGADRRAGAVPSAVNRGRKGGFSRSCESPSKARGCASGGSKSSTLCIQDTPGSDFRDFVAG